MLAGENGILTKATNAREQTEIKNADEAIKVVISELKIEKSVGKMTIEEFLASKVPNELNSYEKISDNEYELEKDGYVLIIDADGNIIEEIQKAGIRPKIANIKITLEDGTEIEDNTQVAGVKLKVMFDATIDGGQIKEVTPGILLENGKVEYITDGNEKTISFTVKGEVDGKIYTKTAKIAVESKYVISEESLLKGIEKVTISSASRPIQVEGNRETVVYNTNTIVYDGNLTFDGTDKGITNISLSDTTYSIGDPNNDVGTASSYAKNMVVLKVNGDLTINEGITLTACASTNGYGGPKGLFIYCTGTLTNNGTISMTARGAYAEGQNVYIYKNADGSYEYVPAIGGTGAASVNTSGLHNARLSGAKGTDGEEISLRALGGGGSGAVSNYICVQYSGAGSSATSYSGGTGGGGNHSPYASKVRYGSKGAEFGGKGGACAETFDYPSTSGSGNPGSMNGTGGLLIVYANNMNNIGKLVSCGVGAAECKGATGGSSGGGSINVFYKNNEENIKGKYTVTGGSSGNGGAGGNGTVTTGNISSGTFVKDE